MVKFYYKFKWFLLYSWYLYCGTSWRWSQEWPKSVGAKNKRHIQLKDIKMCAFIRLCTNDKFTVIKEHMKFLSCVSVHHHTSSATFTELPLRKMTLTSRYLRSVGNLALMAVRMDDALWVQSNNRTHHTAALCRDFRVTAAYANRSSRFYPCA